MDPVTDIETVTDELFYEPKPWPWLLAGLGVGIAVGGAVGYFVTKRQLETKYNKIAEDEIATMREHYLAKAKAADAQAQKLAPVKDIIIEKGYAQPEVSEGPPMAVQPPKGVVEASEIEAEERVETSEKPEVETLDEHRRRLREEAMLRDPELRNVFEESSKAANDGWDYEEELKRRSPDTPYIIHIDERKEFVDYEEITFTYYEGDDVLTNELDEVVDEDDMERLLGPNILSKFGHGSDSADVVYVRNDALETVFEVAKDMGSFAEKIHGFKHSDYERRPRRGFDDDEPSSGR